jgi:nitrogen regulatory protein P-II 1
MKLITAIIRPEKLDEMIGILIDHRVCGLTVTEVSGFGQQLGHLPGQPSWAGPYRAALLPKVRLEVLTLDDDAETMIEAIAKQARTETIGDGKIWMTSVDSVVRIRTGERDRDAV